VATGKKTAQNGRYKGLADKALLACVLIFAAATFALLQWPAKWLIFLQSVAAAAIVGGIADWYGVVSIYGRPLGISYRTEIIVQKRAQLVAAMRSFICDDLLSKDNINEKLQNYSLAERLLELLEDRQQQEGPFVWLSNFGSAILYEVAAKTRTAELAEQISRIFAATVERISPSAEIIRIARWSLDSGYADRLLAALTPGLQKIIGNSGFRSVLREFAETVVVRYVGDSSLRQIFMEKFLHEQLVERAAEQVIAYLEEVEHEPQHPLRQGIIARLAALLNDLETDGDKQANIDIWLRRMLQGDESRNFIAAGIEKFKSGSLSRDGCSSIMQTLLKSLFSRLHNDILATAALNQWLLGQLSGTVERHHDKIGALVEASLTTMDDREIVQFIRGGIENDLQLIRVNGMMFGMAIGMAVAGIRLTSG